MEIDESRWVDTDKMSSELKKRLLNELEWKHEVLGNWELMETPPLPVYVLASTYQIAKSIFDRYFVYTNLSRRIDLRYINYIDKLYGVRGTYIVVSDERYPSNSFYDRLRWIESQAEYRHFEVVHEQDLEKEQVREMVSRQRPKESKNK